MLVTWTVLPPVRWMKTPRVVVSVPRMGHVLWDARSFCPTGVACVKEWKGDEGLACGLLSTRGMLLFLPLKMLMLFVPGFARLGE